MRVHTPADLPALARAALAASGLSQKDAAARLGLSQAVVSKALSGKPGQDPARLRIVREIGGIVLDGPVYVERETA